MQANYIRVPDVRDSLTVANVGGCSYQNTVVILSGARSAESKDPRIYSATTARPRTRVPHPLRSKGWGIVCFQQTTAFAFPNPLNFVILRWDESAGLLPQVLVCGWTQSELQRRPA
jgi:hypothetical protein